MPIQVHVLRAIFSEAMARWKHPGDVCLYRILGCPKMVGRSWQGVNGRLSRKLCLITGGYLDATLYAHIHWPFMTFVGDMHVY